MKIPALILFLLSITAALAFDPNAHSRFGAFGDLNLNLHAVDFKMLPDCPNCSPGYNSGSGTTLSFGLLYEYPVTDMFRIGLRAEYLDYSAIMKRDESTTIIYNGKYYNGTITHTIDTKLTSIGLTPVLGVNIISSFNIFAGVHFGYVMSNHYAQDERITSPNYGTFLDSNGVDTHLRSRNQLSGEIKTASKRNTAFTMGAYYELPLNMSKTFFAAPEFLYSINLLPIVSTDLVKSWSTHVIRTGISIKYIFHPSKPEQYQDIYKFDTIRIEKEDIDKEILAAGVTEKNEKVNETDDIKMINRYNTRTDTLFVPAASLLNGEANAFAYDEKGNKKHLITVKIEEFRTSSMKPLLNYVFFDKKSDRLPERYVRLDKTSLDSFNEDNLFNFNTLETYYQLLNIVGARMQKNSNAKLRIVGCNEGASEDNDKDLSLRRAKAVAAYLQQTWGIDSKRLKVGASNLPEKYSEPVSDSIKMEENRRVELYSDDFEILKPVYSTSVTSTFTPDIVNIETKVRSKLGIESASLDLSHNDKIISENKFTGSIPEKIAIDLKTLKDYNLTEPGPLQYYLVLNDKKKQFKSEVKKIDVNLIKLSHKIDEKIEDKRLDKYSLILFDFDKYDISGRNTRIIDLIKSRLEPESKIKISGYTDLTGNDNYNLQLSENRCKSVKEALKRPDADAKGFGKTVILYNNNLPEGRFYSRTVDVEVITPVK